MNERHVGTQQLEPSGDPEWDDPLAVEIGLYIGTTDIPCEGWPAEVKPEVIERLAAYILEDDS